MELSKKDIGKIIRGVKNGRIQLKMEKSNSSPKKDILSTIIVNGLVQRNYICCCICKQLLKKENRTMHVEENTFQNITGKVLLLVPSSSIN